MSVCMSDRFCSVLFSGVNAAVIAFAANDSPVGNISAQRTSLDAEGHLKVTGSYVGLRCKKTLLSQIFVK